MIISCRWLPVGLRLASLVAAWCFLAAGQLGAQQDREGQPERSTPVAEAYPGADASEPAVPEKAGKVITARRVVGEPPRIDGVLDDPAWAAADSLDDLVQWEPENMAPASERTVVRILYDNSYIYVAARAYDREPHRIGTGLGRRDNPPASDEYMIGFDPRHDHQTGYVFSVNASGVRSDFQFLDDTRSDSDYDAVWDVKTSVDSLGWSAEFRIPFSQMRFSVPEGTTTWGLDMRRVIHRTGEITQWVGRPRGERGQVSRWGHVVFEEGLSPPRRVEVTPYSLVRHASLNGVPGAQVDTELGMDLRLGLGTFATLSATVMPDFGQVEADPAVLNLSIFETFFPERRPFFLEDGNVFIPPYGLFRLFHSRRIGRRPGQLPLNPGESLVSRPDQTTLLGAAKVTGKNAGWTYGAVSALTDAEYALVERPIEGGGTDELERGRTLIEPRTSYSAARVQRDVLGGSSNVGWIGTAVLRDGAPDAFTSGVDYNLRWNRQLWYLNGHWAVSRAPAGGELVTGLGGVSNFGRNGKHLGLNVHVDHFGKDFRINDVGFLRTRTDRSAVGGGFNLRQPDPWRGFRRMGSWVNAWRSWNGDGLVFERGYGIGADVMTQRFQTIGMNVGRNAEALDDLDTRGGPPIVTPAGHWVFGWFQTDSRRSWRGFLDHGRSSDAAGGREHYYSGTLRLQPSARVQASVSSSYVRRRTAAQWIRNTDATGDGEIDHVYGTLDSDVLNLTLRGTFAVRPDLTLELYLQPFVAVGNYSDIRRLARPRSFEFEPVEIPFDPDFNRKSFRSNAVFRWEYMPGSTLFLVWNVQRADLARPGRFDATRDLADALRGDGDSIFLVKASYWLSW